MCLFRYSCQLLKPYPRMVGELKGLGITVSATTVRAWLRAAGLGPAGKRRQTTWREFVRAHRQSLLAVDFFTVETVWLQRLYILFFIELGARRVRVAGCTPSPNAPWVIRQARQLSWTLAERSEPIRFLIRDRDQKFTDRFDDLFRSEGIEVVRTPFRAPQANGVAERFVCTVHSECFDRLLTLNQQHLERVLQAFIEHTTGTGHIARYPSRHLRHGSRLQCPRHQGTLAFCAEIVSVVLLFTSTCARREQGFRTLHGPDAMSRPHGHGAGAASRSRQRRRVSWRRLQSAVTCVAAYEENRQVTPKGRRRRA